LQVQSGFITCKKVTNQVRLAKQSLNCDTCSMSSFFTDGVEVFDRPLGAQPEPRSATRGGFRAGAGAKPAGYVKPPEIVALDKAKARKEAAMAEKAELELMVAKGQYGDRAAFRQAVAMVISSFVQTARSIPDNLERRLGISPEIAQAIGAELDESLNNLADELEMIAGGENAQS
jgi:hypothetical protein